VRGGRARAMTTAAGRGELRMVGSMSEEFQESARVAAAWVKLNEAELKTRLGSTETLSLNDSAPDFLLEAAPDKFPNKHSGSVSPV
jgi:ATP-dependent Lon protease